jgi:transcriptional antiterminator RfaH
VYTAKVGWYIVKTAKGKETFVQRQLSAFVDDTFLPMLRTKRMQWGKVAEGVIPLFPSYIFARFLLVDAHYRYRIAHSPGVVGIVGLGDDPCELEESVVEKIKGRMTDGVVLLPRAEFRQGQAVDIVQGPLRGIDGLFQRYLSGAERVAILLETIHGTLRAVVPADSVSPRAS